MHQTLDNITTTKKQELHEDIVASKEVAQKEKDQIMNRINNETQIQKFERLFKEYERQGIYPTAEHYIQETIKLNERDIQSWVRYYKFAMKTDNIAKAEECLREALSIEPENYDLLLVLSSLLCQRKRYREAAFYVKHVLSVNLSHIPANLLLAIIYNTDEHQGSAKKHIEIAKRKKMRDLNLLIPLGDLKKNLPLIEPTRQLSNDEQDDLYYSLADFLLQYKQCDIVEKVMSYIQNKESNHYNFSSAKCQFIRHSYKECVKVIDKVLEKDPRNQKALKYRGHALFLQGEYDGCEEAYVKAIRIRPPPISLTLFERLGESYLLRKLWADAQVVFYKCCSDPKVNSAISWKNLGVSYLKLEKFEEAEIALNQANILDNNNAEIWGNLTIMCLLFGKRLVQAAQTYKEAFRLGLSNVEQLSEIASLYFKLEDYQKSSECLKKAIEIEPDNASLFYNLAEAYTFMEGSQNLAIEQYEKSLQLAKEESEKKKIAQKLSFLINQDPATITKYQALLSSIQPLLS